MAMKGQVVRTLAEELLRSKFFISMWEGREHTKHTFIRGKADPHVLTRKERKSEHIFNRVYPLHTQQLIDA